MTFQQRDRLAMSIATALDAEIMRLCVELGEDPEDVAKRTRDVLLSALEEDTLEEDKGRANPR